MFLDIFHAFVDYKPLSGNDVVVKEGIMLRALLHSWLLTGLICWNRGKAWRVWTKSVRGHFHM